MKWSNDQTWTRFVRMWKRIAREAQKRWLNSPTRIKELVREHPLPWRIERDWSWEVIASDGAYVANKMTCEEAAAFIAIAEEVSRDP